MQFAYWLKGYTAKFRTAPSEGEWKDIIAEMNRQIVQHEYRPTPIVQYPQLYSYQPQYPYGIQTSGVGVANLTVTSGGIGSTNPYATSGGVGVSGSSKDSF